MTVETPQLAAVLSSSLVSSRPTPSRPKSRCTDIRTISARPETVTPRRENGCMTDESLSTASTEVLEHECTTLAAQIAAATCRFLLVIAELDRREAWSQ